MPPREHLGWYTRPGACDALADWLARCRADRFVVSADMLCYGGLVASRTPVVEADLALRRLDSLRELRRRRPDGVIYAFGIIMRLGTTVTDAESMSLHLGLGSIRSLWTEFSGSARPICSHSSIRSRLGSGPTRLRDTWRSAAATTP